MATISAVAIAAAAACSGPRTPGDLRRALWAENPLYLRDTRPNVAIAAAEGAEQPWLAPPDRVALDLWVTYLSVVAPQTSTFTVEMTMTATWSDLRLRFNTSEDGGCFRPQHPVEFDRSRLGEIWTPDLYFNTMALIGPKDDSTLAERIQVDADGAVTWTSATRKSFRCDFDYARVPFDVHECEIPVSAWRGGGGDEIVFSKRWAIKPQSGGGAADWKVTELAAHNESNFLGETRVVYKITLERKSGYYVWCVN